MFVQTNDLIGLKGYFKDKLIDSFSTSEINLMLKVLVCNRLKINNSEYLLLSGQKFSESDLLYFRSVVKRLLENEPFQYIVGATEFYGIELKVDQRALIPRPETEELVDWVLHDINSIHSPVVLDLCSGSGCIALALKSKMGNANISAIEFDKGALSLLQENIATSNLVVEAIEGDVLMCETFVSFRNESFDVWVSNPPYIPQKDRSIMEDNVLKYEPDIALFVEDDDALIFYRGIAEKALKYLKKGGLLFFEIHEDLSADTSALLSALGFVNIEVRKDLQGKDRMIKAIK